MASTAAATFNATEVRKLSTLNHLRTQHMNVLKEWEIRNEHEPEAGVFKAKVLEPGYVAFYLHKGIIVNIGPNYAVQIVNPTCATKLGLSGCGTQMALIHPQGRVLQYNARIEVQCLGTNGVDKSAKLWPRGISFTSSNCAITYLVDEAGTRSTSDYFYDLFYEDNTDSKAAFKG